MRINFYNESRTIYVVITHNYQRKKISTRQKIAGKWSSKKQRLTDNHYLDQDINDLLDSIEHRAISFIRSGIREGSPKRIDQVADYVRSIITPVDTQSFRAFTANWIKLKEQQNISKASLKHYRNVIKFINEVHPGLRFDQVDQQWLIKTNKHLKGYSQNYARNVLKRFRMFMEDAYIDGIHDNRYHKKRGFIPDSITPDNVYLNMEELQQLYQHKYSTTSLRNAVNLFLVGCFTGQRFQTFSTIKKSMIVEKQGIKLISLVQGKTKTRVSIPVTDILGELLEKDIKSISNQKLNIYIKEAAAEAGFNYSIQLNGEKVTKAEVIYTHTARRSFATNMVLAGVPIQLIMKITGHKTESQFKKYIKYDDIEAAIAIKEEINKAFTRIA